MKLFFYCFVYVAVVTLMACDSQTKQSTIEFELTYDNSNIGCDGFPVLLKWRVEQLQFFISNLQVTTSDNQKHHIRLKDTDFQTNNIALLSLLCDQGHISERNTTVFLAEGVNVDQVVEISFDLGIPFSVNHLNPLTQDSPLNVASMFWVWRTGHKFMRVEMSGEHETWWFHLGSTGCSSASPVRAPQKACLNPNRFNYQLSTTISQPIEITFSLEKLLHGLHVNEQNSCQSEPDNVKCNQLFSNVQQAFSVVHQTSRH